MVDFFAYTDGGSRGNPGPSGIGGVIYSPLRSVLAEISEYIGEATNNYAEYQAVLVTLKKVIEMGIKNIHFYIDSKLIVEQLNGNYKVKNKKLKIVYDEIKELIKEINITFTHIRRNLNIHADQLVNKAIDKELKR